MVCAAKDTQERRSNVATTVPAVCVIEKNNICSPRASVRPYISNALSRKAGTAKMRSAQAKKCPVPTRAPSDGCGVALGGNTPNLKPQLGQAVASAGTLDPHFPHLNICHLTSC